MGARHLTHDQVCDAAAKAAAIESNHGWQPAERYAWLTEAELAARVREELVRAGCVDRAQIKLNGSGRKGKSVARLADIVVGKDEVHVEVVYLFADAAPSPGKPLSDDLEWLVQGAGRHVIAFLPRMRPGYRVQNHRTPYDLAHISLTLLDGEHLLTDSLQVGGLSDKAKKLCAGILHSVTGSPHGTTDRWSLAPTLVSSALATRSIAGATADPIWAIVWTTP